MAKWWLGPWSWSNGWQAPANAVPVVDLRTPAQCAATVTPSGFGLFSTANAVNLGGAYELLGAGVPAEQTLNPPTRTLLETELSLPGSLAAGNLGDAILEILTVQADPTGAARCLPMVPNHLRRFDVPFDASTKHGKQWQDTDPESDVAFELLKRTYKTLYDRVVAETLPPDHHRKWLGYQCIKFGYSLATNDYRRFQGEDVPDEAPLPPTTTYTESFNTSDGTTLGPDLTWTEVDATFSIVSNSVSYDGNALHRYARAEHDLSGDDHYGQITIVEGGTGGTIREAGVLARVSTSVKDYYAAYVANSANVKLYKLVGGTATQLGSTTGISFGTSKILKLTCDGSDITLSYDGSDVIAVTDTAVTGNLRCGIGNFNSSSGTTVRPRGDAFQAADLGAPPSSTNPYYQWIY